MQQYTIQILGTYITKVFTAATEKDAKLMGKQWAQSIHPNFKTKLIN